MSRRYGMTNAEANASAAKFRETCPKCKSQRTYVVGLSFGMYHGCHECGKKWGWCNAAGTEVSRQKFDERAEADRAEWRSKSARSWRMDAPAGEETDMAKKPAKKSKGAKGAKAKSKSAQKRKSANGGGTIASVITAELKKNAAVETDAVLAAVKKAFPAAKTTASCVSWYRWKLGIKKPAKKKATAKKS